MPIARVEPLTTARSLRGPFDYRLPGRRSARSASAASCSSPSGAGACSAWSSSSPSAATLAPERLAEPIEALEAGVPPELVGLGLWVGREYCSTPARGLELVLPPGTGAPAGRSPSAARRSSRRPRRRRPPSRAGSGWELTSGGRWSCCATPAAR